MKTPKPTMLRGRASTIDPVGLGDGCDDEPDACILPLGGGPFRVAVGTRMFATCVRAGRYYALLQLKNVDPADERLAARPAIAHVMSFQGAAFIGDVRDHLSARQESIVEVIQIHEADAANKLRVEVRVALGSFS